jgi:hypothetical protein
MSGHDPLGHLHELALGTSRVLTQHVEGGPLVDPMPLQQDALGSLRDSAATEGAFQVVVFGEAPEHDVDRALQLLGISAVDDIGEDPRLAAWLMNARSWTCRIAMTGHLASWTIRSMIAKAWLVPSLTMARATSGRSVAISRATSVSDDSLAMTSWPRPATVRVTTSRCSPGPVSNQDPERDVGIRIHPDESATLPLGRSTPVSRRGLSGYSG